MEKINEKSLLIGDLLVQSVCAERDTQVSRGTLHSANLKLCAVVSCASCTTLRHHDELFMTQRLKGHFNITGKLKFEEDIQLYPMVMLLKIRANLQEEKKSLCRYRMVSKVCISSAGTRLCSQSPRTLSVSTSAAQPQNRKSCHQTSNPRS